MLPVQISGRAGPAESNTVRTSVGGLGANRCRAVALAEKGNTDLGCNLSSDGLDFSLPGPVFRLQLFVHVESSVFK